MNTTHRPGAVLALLLLCVYGGIAVSVDFPQAAMGIQSDEATYYMMGHSLAQDGDLTYRRDDLLRVWKDFDTGPAGVFLKRGSDIVEWGFMRRPPFFWTRLAPDPDGSRLYFGKSFIYPLVAAPLVKVFGTNGFLVLHALLLGGVAWCAYLFLHARAPALPSVLLADAFVMASVVPVYFVWITPELFNFALGCFAYFCWLYKEVASPDHMPRRLRWLAGPRSDVAAALTTREFISCCNIARRESFESRYWLRLSRDDGLIDSANAEPAIAEADEIGRILTTIIRKSKDK